MRNKEKKTKILRGLIPLLMYTLFFLQLTTSVKGEVSYTATVIGGGPNYSDKTIRIAIPDSGGNGGWFNVKVTNTGDAAIQLTQSGVELQPATLDIDCSPPSVLDVIPVGGSVIKSFAFTVYPTADKGTYTCIMWFVADGKKVYVDPYLITYEEAVVTGGVWVPADKFGLLAPYIGVASTILVATVAAAIYGKRVKRKMDRR